MHYTVFSPYWTSAGPQMRCDNARNNEERGYDFEPFFDSYEVAKLMGVHPQTVKRRARSGEIPGIENGNLWRFCASMLESRANTAQPMHPESPPSLDEVTLPIPRSGWAAGSERRTQSIRTRLKFMVSSCTI
jgi:excisionase family DNA binding protein